MRLKLVLNEVFYPTKGKEPQIPEHPHNLPQHIPLDLCWNVFRVAGENLYAPISVTYDKDTLDEATSKSSIFVPASKGISRIMDQENFATCFYLLPDTIITNAHVLVEMTLEKMDYIVFNPATTTIYNRFDAVRYYRNGERSGLFVEKRLLFTGTSLNRIQRIPASIHSAYIGKDPILGKIGDFNYVDAALVELNGCNTGKVLFVPSPEILQPGDKVFLMHFPGAENFDDPISVYPGFLVKWLSDMQFLKEVFHGYGRLCLSTGRVLAPFHIKEKKWVANVDFKYDKYNQHAIISNESCLVGSSGGVLLSEKCVPITKGEWTLIPFHGIHFGGEFVKCKDCLELSKDPENTVCSKCRHHNNDSSYVPEPFVYNYSLSVHHPIITELYKNHIAEVIRDTFGSVEVVESYLEMHN